jgi:hypothetical protein
LHPVSHHQARRHRPVQADLKRARRPLSGMIAYVK